MTFFFHKRGCSIKRFDDFCHRLFTGRSNKRYRNKTNWKWNAA